MSTLTCEVGENWPLPCLFNQNSNRVVNLLEIMDLFNAYGLYQVLHRLEILEERLKSSEFLPLNPEQTGDIFKTLEFAEEQLTRAKFTDLSYKAKRNTLSISQPASNTASVAAILGELYLDIEKQVMDRKFALVWPDRSEYAGKEQLFGAKVHEAFPKARHDVGEAGNCLAVEANTATVFHLMRVSEHGLRALAYDRRVKVPRRPLDLATWDDIIKELEKAEKAIANYPRTPAREAQFEFYHGAPMEFRAFKNVWRNSIAHTRTEMIGEDGRNEALRVMRHVRQFMTILATRIAERKRTPKIWT